MFFSDMSVTVKEAGFRPVMVEGELPDKAREKKKAKKSATEKLFLFERAKRFEGLRFKTMLWEDSS